MIRPTKPKSEKTSIGSKAAKLAQDTAASLNKGAESIANTRSNISAITDNIAAVAGSVSALAGAVTTGRAQTAGAVVDVQQATAGNYGSKSQRSEIVPATDIYGGLAIPELDFNGMIPTDFLNPNIVTTATEDQLTAGLENYAGATRAQKLYQAGFNYIAEVGKTKQAMHKAQASVIKGAIEGIKVQQEIVRFDRQNIELETDGVKLEQSAEKLNQEGIKLLGMQKETTQITRKIEAIELKRDAEIKAVEVQTQMIIQKYLIETMS
jgi:prophage DNA circulation protein